MRRHQSKVYRERDRGARRGLTLVELLTVIVVQDGTVRALEILLTEFQIERK
ncbi:MAG: prepilin-type N-terminal cleavage/methylation domain-containing protein [Armatimonadetes bacterium]|nr:MAG: prepilin-type N-terminal cleavage/methylation domain-containing protein [Armatimonadota bacterium]